MTRETPRLRDGIIVLAKLGIVQVRVLFGSGRFWSGILCAAMFSRGTSFIDRPPKADTVATGAIEAFISYPAWGWMLVMASVMIGLAYASKRLRVLGIFGHLFGMFAYGTFSFSTVIAAIWFEQAWATAGTFMSQGLLHAACAIYLGNDIGQLREVKGDE